MSGDISTDTTWTKDKSPYFVTGDVIVGSNATLTIEPGVEVKFMARMDDRRSGEDSSLSELSVQGTLNAIGTTTKRIKFTSFADSPAAGDWWGIILLESSKARFQYCGISYGSYGIRLYSFRGQALIDNCVISGGGYGIVGDGIYSTGRLTINNNEILGNIGDYGIYLTLYSPPTTDISIENNIISGNGYGIYCKNVPAPVSIEHNTIINNRYYGIYNNASSPTIKYNYLSGNSGYAIFITDPAKPVIAYNSIFRNSVGIFTYSNPTVNYNNLYGNGGDFYNAYSNDIDGRYNYWGTTATAEMNAGANPKNISTIWDYFDGGGGRVDYSNWLNSPIILPPTGIMSTPADTTIDLSWTGSEGASGYYLYYGLSSGTYNPPIDIGNKTSYQLPGLSNNTNYYIALTTYDKDKKESTSSYELKVTTGGEAPAAPTNLTGKASKDTISLSWQANTESDLVGYKVYYDTDSPGAPYKGTRAKEGSSPIDVGNKTSFTLSGLTDGLYYLAITAYDKEGNESGYSQEVKVRVDNTPPTGTISINDGAESITSLSVTLTLSATDAGIGMGQGAQMRFSNDNKTWSDPEAYSTTKNNWDLTAYGGSSDEGSKTVYALFSDAAGNWMTRAVSDTIRYISETDTTAPSSSITAPGDGATVSGKVYTIKGTASDDKSGVASVEISTDGGTSWQKATGTTNWQYDWTLPADGTYTIKSRATDKKGNIETPGKGITVIVDNQGISTPTGLTATGGAKSVSLSWSPNKESDLAGYNIYREIDPRGNYTTKLNQELIKTTSYTDEAVEQGKTYWYKITAVDLAGNESNKSAAVSAKVGAITVWMPDIKGEAGDKVSLPINVSNATGVGSSAAGLDIKLTYNPNLLTPTKVSKTNLTKGFTLYDNISQANGQLNISGINFRGDSIKGEGALVEVEFSVNSAAVDGNTATLSFVEVKLYDEAAKPLIVDYTDTATFTVGTTYKRGDLNGDGTVDSADALIAMKIATGEIEPSKEQKQAGDIDGNGKINTADAILILRMAVGLPIHPSSVASKTIEALLIHASSDTINVSIGDHAGEAGSTITMPIIIDNLTGVAGADILLTYDPDILTATGASTTSLSTGFNLQYKISSGAIAISILNTTELSGGSGAFVNVSLQVNAGAKTGASTSLTLAQASLYGQYGQDLSLEHTIKTTNGKFTVAQFAPGTPTSLKSSVDGNTVNIQWNANSDSNLDHYNLYVGYASKGYNLSGSPFNVGKATSLTASDIPEGTYYLALSAVNSAGLESSLSEEIKVVVGAKPTITISSNKDSYSPGDTLTLSFALSNPMTTSQVVDVFLGIVAPDGSIYFFDSSPFLPKLVPARADDPKSFTPASTSLELSPGYDSPSMPFFSMTLPTGLPEGIYQAFAILAEPGSVQAGSPKIIGNPSIVSFRYSP